MRVDETHRSIGEAFHGGVDPSELARHGLAADQVVDFSSNILPFGPCPSVRSAVQQTAFESYPDRECHALREAIANRHAVNARKIIIGNGCSELIHLVAGALIRPGDAALVVGPTFSEYARATRLASGIVHECATTSQAHFAVPADEIDSKLSQTPMRLAWVCNPNNPTGKSISSARLNDWVERYPTTVFVIDESYIEFTEQTETLIRCDAANVIVLRSMTKSHAIAGLRLGFAVVPDHVRFDIQERRIPWSVSSIAQAAGIAAITDRAHVAQGMSQLARSKRTLFDELARHGFSPVPSDTGFFLLPVRDATQVRHRLLRAGMLVRDCHSFGIEDCLRISVQTDARNRRLADSLSKLAIPQVAAAKPTTGLACDCMPIRPAVIREWDDDFREQLNELFRLRRDVRRFHASAIPSGSMKRWLRAACLAPSVGLSQPWRFVSVSSAERRAQVTAEFESQNELAAASYLDPTTSGHYQKLKLAGLREAPEHLAVFVQTDPDHGRGLGRTTMPETVAYSVVAAIQNLWLAARSDGVGVGWISILRPDAVAAILDVPRTWQLIAYLCLGYPQSPDETIPELQREGWETRMELDNLWVSR